MTAPSPLLAASTEQLAAALAETVPAGAFDARDIAVYLIESGAVVPAESLADDETLEWKPGRWWRAVGPDGDLWAESSNEAEIRERARPGDTVQNLMVLHAERWQDAAALEDR